MKLEIVQAGNPILRQRARALSTSEISSKEIQSLIADMRTCMWDAPGVGLAAPQVGLSLQLAVIEDREEYHKDVPESQLRERERRPVPFHVIINPTLTPLAPLRNADNKIEQVEFYEGCLSLAGFTAVVPRSRSVRVECLDDRGKQKVIEATGWYARILQHEVDHLYGNMYIDRMRSKTFSSLDNWAKFWKGKPVGEAKNALNADQE